MEQGPEHLPQIVVVGTLFKPQGSAVIQICGEFSCQTKNIIYGRLRAGLGWWLTWVSPAQLFNGGSHFFLGDAFVLLALGCSLQALPRQGASVEVHQHVAKRLKIVSSALLCMKKGDITNSLNVVTADRTHQCLNVY